MSSPTICTDAERLRKGFAIARQINREHGKSYYWATQLFPIQKRQATYALYAFFRLADDIVDAPDIVTLAGNDRARRELAQFRQSWVCAIEAGGSPDPVLHAASHVCREYSIPNSYSECFLNSMSMDLSCTRYQTYSDLAEYMDGSAASVGLMMSHVIGFSDRSALPHLANLGNAMQLTNFLRDIDEDFHDYGRIYIPTEDLERFGLSEDDIACRRYSQSWQHLMEFQAERVRALYADANLGIDLLCPDVKRPVRVAAALYSAILGKLRERDWNVFAGRVRTSTFEKLILTLRTPNSA